MAFKPNHQNQDDNSKVIQIRRVSKKTKGGNNISFTALVVAGDKEGMVGVGLGKAPSVAAAIKKASRLAHRDMIRIPLENGTIPFPVTQKFKAAKILLKPAPKGTGIIAGGAVRAIVEAAGITDIVSKCLGSNNKMTNVFATFKAMQSIELLGQKQNYLTLSLKTRRSEVPRAKLGTSPEFNSGEKTLPHPVIPSKSRHQVGRSRPVPIKSGGISSK